MSDVVLIQQIYPNRGYECLLDYAYPFHKAYCEKWNIDYRVHKTETYPVKFGAWDKVVLIQEALKTYPLVVWLDADTLIKNSNIDFRTVPNPPDTVGAVLFEETKFYKDHYNVGALYVRNGARTKEFIRLWLKKYPGQPRWYEQYVFNYQLPQENIYRLPEAWNHTIDRHFSDEVIVKGFHSVRGADLKLRAMKGST